MWCNAILKSSASTKRIGTSRAEILSMIHSIEFFSKYFRKIQLGRYTYLFVSCPKKSGPEKKQRQHEEEK
jgi:hypothetical protein